MRLAIPDAPADVVAVVALGTPLHLLHPLVAAVQQCYGEALSAAPRGMWLLIYRT